MLSPLLIISFIAVYFLLLLAISYYTGKNAGNSAYFIGNKASPWYAVAFGMIGDSLSGVTFISLPGTVATSQFSYMQMVLGYVVGYLVIAQVLLPLYYRLNLTSIYSYLGDRFGAFSQKTGSFFFLVSRTIGAALRLYLAAGVLQIFVFDKLGVPFWFSVMLTIVLMLLYTYKGGIKTLVWTDTFQSSFLLMGVVLSIVAIVTQLDLSFSETASRIYQSDYSKMFFWDWKERNYFWKQFLSGAFISIVMTGLDQNMMQKNLSMRTLGEAQKNIRWFSIVIVIVNLFFLSLGALLYIYSSAKGVDLPASGGTGKIITDKVFPVLALEHLGIFAAIMFITGLTAATFSSADSVLTTLTTSFCVDFLRTDDTARYTEKQKTTIRHITHAAFGVVLLITILLCERISHEAVLTSIFTVAAYTYGPLLGLFAFGLFSTWQVRDKGVPLVCLLSPLLTYVLNENSEQWFSGYKFGFELLMINGLFTLTGLILLKRKEPKPGQLAV